jgi:hypothetical protein
MWRHIFCVFSLNSFSFYVYHSIIFHFMFFIHFFFILNKFSYTYSTLLYTARWCIYNIISLLSIYIYIYIIRYIIYLITWRSLDYMEVLAAMVFSGCRYDLHKLKSRQLLLNRLYAVLFVGACPTSLRSLKKEIIWIYELCVYIYQIIIKNYEWNSTQLMVIK